MKPKGRDIDYSLEQLLNAIKDSGGIVSTIAKRLDCHWNTADKYIKMYPETIQLLQDEAEKILDLCENTMIRAVQNGDVNSAKWILSTKGKKRGYTEKHEIELNNSEGITINILPVQTDGNKDT